MRWLQIGKKNMCTDRQKRVKVWTVRDALALQGTWKQATIQGPINFTQDRQGHGWCSGWWRGAGVSVWLAKVTGEWQEPDSQVPHQSSAGRDLPAAFIHSFHSRSPAEWRDGERERERRSVRQPDRPQRLRDNYCLYRVLSVFSDREKEKWQGWKGEPAGGTLRYILLKEQLIVQVRPVQTTAGHARKGWFLRVFFPNDIWNFKRNALIISIPHIGMSWPTFISNIWTFFFML